MGDGGVTRNQIAGEGGKSHEAPSAADAGEEAQAARLGAVGGFANQHRRRGLAVVDKDVAIPISVARDKVAGSRHKSDAASGRTKANSSADNYEG